MSDEAHGLGQEAQTRLRFWSANMELIHGSGHSWPGFSYTKEEKERMAALAKTLPSGTFGLWLYLIGPVVFIALAAAIIVGLWLPAMRMLFPNPADVTPLPFVLLLAAAALLALSLGFWAALTVGTSIAVLLGGAGEGYAPEAGDAALYAKARWQIRRMILATCGRAAGSGSPSASRRGRSSPCSSSRRSRSCCSRATGSSAGAEDQ